MGGNQALGFAKSFSATFYCRMCECSKLETQKMTSDRPEKYRTEAKYEQAISLISNSHTVDLKETKGISEYCVLNDLEHFSIMNNWSADIMHDICEGTTVTLLKSFFHVIISKNVLTELDLRNRLAFFDYGKLNAQFLPSELRLGSDKMNQNALQMKYLMHHVPYIFYSEKENDILRDAWSCIQYMLRIMRTIYSNTISEEDLTVLGKDISEYLSRMIRCHEKKLKPKDHNMTHYPEIIRRVGPLVHLSTLRYEMKHKELSTIMANKNNYMNVTKTIAEKCQLRNVHRKYYSNQIAHGAFKKIDSDVICEFAPSFNGHELIKTQQTKFLKFNSDFYENGLIIKFNGTFFEIEYICQLSGEFVFACSKYDRVCFNNFLMSLELKKSIPIVKQFIKHSDLIHSRSYDKKIVGDAIYILSNSLDIQ